MHPGVAVCRFRPIRVLACLLVFGILSDLALDGNCDGISTPTVSGAVMAGSGDGSPDACANGCVPDCFCCTPSVAGGPSVLPPERAPAVSPALLIRNATPTGVHPVPYRPPLASA